MRRLLPLLFVAGWAHTAHATLLLSEIYPVAPNAFVELVNTGTQPVSLAHHHIATVPHYPGLVTGDFPGPGDLYIPLPEDLELAPGARHTLAIAGYEADSGMLVLFYWDGESDRVEDLDLVVWGSTATSVDKTGLSIDGPDADEDASTYAPDTPIDQQWRLGAAQGHSLIRRDFAETGEPRTGGNGREGHDETGEPWPRTWTRSAVPSPDLPNVAMWPVQGIVLQEGVPLSDAQVLLTEPGLAATTDATGRFAIEAVPEGTYTLSISPRSGPPTTSRLTVSGGTAELQIELTAPGALWGRVHAGELGAPELAGTQLTLLESGATTLTDSDGDYRFTGLSLGSYTLQVEREGYRSLEQVVVLRASVYLDLELQPVRSHTLRLELAPMGTEGRVELVPAFQGPASQSGVIGAEGLVLELEEGPHRLILEAPGYRTLTLDLTHQAASTLRLQPVAEAPPLTPERVVGCSVTVHSVPTSTGLALWMVLMVLAGVRRSSPPPGPLPVTSLGWRRQAPGRIKSERRRRPRPGRRP